MTTVLLDIESDSEVKLTINKEYAERYNKWRQGEELQKLKDRYGEDNLILDDDDDSSTSEEEDEVAKDLPQIEKDFFKTLSYLKRRDPSIYDQNVTFFSDCLIGQKAAAADSKKKKDEKPLFLRDYERKLILENEGKIDESDGENAPRSASPSHVEEQRRIKESFKNALEDSEDDEKDDWGSLFKKRDKTQEEMDKEEEDYREWLKGQKDELTNKAIESDLRPLHDYWNDPNIDSSEAFLRDYILNKRFLEPVDDHYIPTYNEIVHDSSEDLSDDERTVEKQEEFEHKYNFRFEEPDKEFIKRYPRIMEQSLRKKDDRRKKKRQEIQERKQHEKEIKKEEIKQLKALKRKEIMEKIEKIKSITGNADVGFKDMDLEGDFNPDEHDKRMNELFNDDFYGLEEDKQKPEFPELDNELEIENWNEWRRENVTENGQDDHYYEPHCEDPDFNMDCEYDPNADFQRRLVKASKGKKKHHRQSKFAEVLAQSKPVFDPNDQSFDEYVSEYYNLDFEDIIGDLPCRFKYRKVVPNSFGLTVDEILIADDKELNRWCSLKRTVQYRPEHIELYDQKAYAKKALNESLKRKTLTSLYSEELDDEDSQHIKKKSHGDKTDDIIEGESVYPSPGLANVQSRKNKRKSLPGPENMQAKKKNKKMLQEEEGSQNDSEMVNVKSEEDCKQNNNAGIAEVSEANVHLIADPIDADTTAGNLQNPVKSRRKKRRKHQNKDSAHTVNDRDHCSTPAVSRSMDKSKKKIPKKNQKFGVKRKPQIPMSDSRLRAYGINPKKFKNKLLYGRKPTNS